MGEQPEHLGHHACSAVHPRRWARPHTLVLDIAAPHLRVQGAGDTLVEVVGNLDGIGWVGFREPGTRKLLAEVEVARKSFSWAPSATSTWSPTTAVRAAARRSTRLPSRRT